MLRETDDYEIPGADPEEQPGTFTDTQAFSAGATAFHGEGRFGFAYSRFENEYGLPEADEDVRIDMDTNRYRFEGELGKPLPGVRLVRVQGVYSDYDHSELADGDVGQTFDNDQFDGRLELLHDPWLGFVGAVGLQGGHRDFEAGGEAAEFLAPTETRTVAVYLFEERPLAEWVDLELGLRVESTQVDGESRGGSGRERNFVPVSGAVGLRFEPFGERFGGWTFGLTGAVSQRAPSDVELFAAGPHEATGTFELGEADLDEETSYKGELRIAGGIGPVAVETATFVTRYDDYVFAELTGNTVDEDGAPVPVSDPEALDELFYRSRDALFYGFELQAEADVFEAFGGTFGLKGQFDVVRARFRSGGGDRDLPRITPIRWGGSLLYEMDRVRAELGFLRTEAQNDLAEFESRTDDFTLLNASLTFRVALLDERVPVDLTVVGRNLTNTRARNHISFNKDEVLLPGRNVRFGVRARF
ncbi:MAG: TonB-dependent receptor [Proteobacteria bacterium]|nr:TonB-dependent receptor [Pseudomonadota bacterium]